MPQGYSLSPPFVPPEEGDRFEERFIAAATLYARTEVERVMGEEDVEEPYWEHDEFALTYECIYFFLKGKVASNYPALQEELEWLQYYLDRH